MKTIGWKGAENTVKNLKWYRMHLEKLESWCCGAMVA